MDLPTNIAAVYSGTYTLGDYVEGTRDEGLDLNTREELQTLQQMISEK